MNSPILIAMQLMFHWLWWEMFSPFMLLNIPLPFLKQSNKAQPIKKKEESDAFIAPRSLYWISQSSLDRLAAVFSLYMSLADIKFGCSEMK